jgi:DNA polymerase III delta prime subunit
MILSHYRAGTGAVLVESREEARLLAEILRELPGAAPVATIAAPGGPIRDARSGQPSGQSGLLAGYQWAASGPGRVLVVYDWHTLADAPGHWRALIEALPALRSPRGAGPSDPASLVIFCAPSWQLGAQNPLRGALPVLAHAAPSRTALAELAGRLAGLGDQADAVAAALAGLPADVAEQAAAECLAARGRWDCDHLRGARRRALREAGLELWPAVPELGGLAGLRDYAEAEVIPWVDDPQLAVRRILCAGVPGVGKSYCARWLAGRLGCEAARLSVPSLKASLVGQSEANLRRALRAVDGLAAESPLVLVIDEIDAAVQRSGLDSGVSSGLFSELLTWLQESSSQAVVLATLNHLDALDAAIESRFAARFFFDLPTHVERCAVAAIHLRRLGCEAVEETAAILAELSEGWSSREIAEHAVPSIARRSRRRPTPEIVREVCAGIVPASRTQERQLAEMRRAAGSLRRANDPLEPAATNGVIRRIGGVA